jgi:pimeloyl-ACP methyl ester carboxylesterase
MHEQNHPRVDSYITAKDGTQIYYKDWGTGQPIVFTHGWPLSADAFEDQMFFLAAHGFRCIAHDRRGHGRSSQTWGGNDMDTYADDLAALVEALDLKDAIHVGHSTGGGQITRYIGRYGADRVAKIVLIGAVPPLLLQTPANPKGIPIEVFDQTRRRACRSCRILPPVQHSVLWLEQGRREGFGRVARLVRGASDAGESASRLRMHQSVFGNRLHRGPETV